MRVYRICKRKYVGHAMDGQGAKLNSGRWNNIGTEMIYCAGSVGLAMMEIMVHVKRVSLLENHYCVIPVDIDDGIVLNHFDAEAMLDDWRDIRETRAFGDRWVAGEHYSAYGVISVPSVVVPFDRNYIINPVFKGLSGYIQVGEVLSLKWDERLKE